MTDFHECFRGKVALITGAAGAFGSGTAAEFAQYGARLALNDIDGVKLAQVVEELKKLGLTDEMIFWKQGDMMTKADVDAFVGEAGQYFGRIDYVINIVGLKRTLNFEDATLEDLDLCLNSCVRPAFMVSKAALKYLIDSKGVILNMSSVSGVRAFHAAIPYGTAKAALNHMTRIMASGLAKHGVRVLAVAPCTTYSAFNIVSGMCKTPEEEQAYLEKSGRAIPFGRIARVSETTKTILYLCSPSAGFMTGCVLPIDGGWTNTLYEPPPQ